MDPRTAAVYEREARTWISRRRPRALEDGMLDAFAARVAPGGRVADLGCGPGWYAAALRERGFRAVALDLSAAMLREAGRRSPGLPRVRADLWGLPFARHSLDGAWATACYMHLPLAELPVALARLHGALRPEAPLELMIANLDVRGSTDLDRTAGEAEVRFDDDEFPGRLFSLLSPERAREMIEGAGFRVSQLHPIRSGFWLDLQARATRTLPDWIAPGLRLLICGLNPSLLAADTGIPFARAGNRFWPAARAAGLIERERDLGDALARGLGFTDCAKRATASAGELEPEEYMTGLARVERLVRRYAPEAVCFVGLDGYRRALDRSASPGWIPAGFGGRPAYLMPSTSGLNAHATPADLALHLRRAAAGPEVAA